MANQKKEFPEVVCPFCQRKLEVPADYQCNYLCSCAAVYWVESHDDLYTVAPQGAEFFGLLQHLVEVLIHRDFDVLVDVEGQYPETGDLQALVFVRPVGQWVEIHQVALEKRSEASQHQRNLLVRAVMALTGAVPLGAGGRPTVREHAALRQHGEGDLLDQQAAVELLITEDSVVFGPIGDVHRQCWVKEFCFGDSPEDVAELKSST
jgi:hypothetical protein